MSRSARAESIWIALGGLFSRDLARVTEVIDEVNKCEAWDGVLRLSLDELVAPELYVHLHRLGALSGIPKFALDILESADYLNKGVQANLREVFNDFLKIANPMGITPILLKGGIDVISDNDRVLHGRMVSDIDILVESDKADELYSELLLQGFREDPISNRSTTRPGYLYHLPPIWHPAYQQYLEIHTRIGNDSEEYFLTKIIGSDAVNRETESGTYAVPSIPFRVLHNAYHHYGRANALNLDDRSFRQALDFSRLVSCVDEKGLSTLLAHAPKKFGYLFDAGVLFTRKLFREQEDRSIAEEPKLLKIQKRFFRRKNYPVANLLYVTLFFVRFIRSRNYLRRLFDIYPYRLRLQRYRWRRGR